jgi:hypothetical protein
MRQTGVTEEEHEWLAERFEAERRHLRAVAYRMLGSVTEADDMFAVSFDEIAPIVGRSPDAARQLASRARRRVRGAPVPDADLSRQREVVDAFAAASRNGDFDALLAVLDPNVVLRTDRAMPVGAPTEFRGARVVAEQAMLNSPLARWGIGRL